MKEPQELKRELREVIRELGAYQSGSFTLASGKKSSFYFDGRRVTLHPQGLLLIASLFFVELSSSFPEAVSGKSVGADPLVAGLLLYSQLQGVSIEGLLLREKRKDHGLKRQIEGNFRRGMQVVLLDDVLTTGESLLFAKETLEREGGEVHRALVLLDREEGGRERVEREGVAVASLFQASDFRT